MSHHKTILCITPNVSVDWTHLVPGFSPGRVWRAAEVSAGCGGKGVNVARAIRALGERAVCAGFLAGHAGRVAAEMAEREGLDGRWTWIDGETRTNVIVLDPDGSHPTVLNAPGPVVTGDGWPRLAAAVLDEASRADCICMCGSVPPGCAPADVGQLVTTLLAFGRPVWVDASGPVLGAAVDARPTGVKVNAAEAGEYLGRMIDTVDDAIAAAQTFRARGIATVVLTLGGAGAVAVTGDGVWRTEPPPLHATNPVGSGDAFLGGLVTALLIGHPMPCALRYATAAGSASALQAVTGLDRDTFRDVVRGVRIAAPTDFHPKSGPGSPPCRAWGGDV
ncbi:MAG: hexose kinase [Alphaproteobacteria bacterium]